MVNKNLAEQRAIALRVISDEEKRKRDLRMKILADQARVKKFLQNN